MSQDFTRLREYMATRLDHYEDPRLADSASSTVSGRQRAERAEAERTAPAQRPSVGTVMESRNQLPRVSIIDSHTGGEPTRVVIQGGPDLGGGSVAEKLEVFRAKHDLFRSAVVNEPRGSDVMVGALLVEPKDRSCVTGVIFFNNVGYLGMCGH